MSDKKRSAIKTHRIKSKVDDPNRHDKTYRFEARKGVPTRAQDVRTTAELMAFLESDEGKNAQVEARIIAHKPGVGFGIRKMKREAFLEAWKKNSDGRKTFRETFRDIKHFQEDDFSRGGIGNFGFSNGNTVGQDFTPLLGGPFYKQLYYWTDYLKMHQDCFFAMNHDPIGKATVEIITDFVMGKGFEVRWEDADAQAMWDAFDEVNDFQNLMNVFCRELSGYGENMLWWLPDNQKYIAFGRDVDKVEKAYLPRIRTIDPSNIVEIITHPEDITRVVSYVWMTPTQYQTYTAKDQKTGELVNGTKFIYSQIPADQIAHVKINAVSNEKRGRSDLFTSLGYMKRLRDSVNYEIISQQKNSAWSIDTTIEGDDADISAYTQQQQELGTIPNAGSEFVHSPAVKRDYLSNQGGSGKGSSQAFEWALSMCSMATRIPISWYGTHLSGGSTRASAIVSTEPVAKFIEGRQTVMKDTIGAVAKRFAAWMKKPEASYEVLMPEIITQDRSAKLKDLYLAQEARWISPRRAGEMAASEFQMRDYEWEQEQADIEEQAEDEPPIGATPLTQPPAAGDMTTKPVSGSPGGAAALLGPTPGKPAQTKAKQAPGQDSTSAITSGEKKAVKDAR